MPANLFATRPGPAAAEEFDELLARPGLRIERIVSSGQCSPPDFWYDQDEGEWVAVLQGEAKLRFADEAAARHLHVGDFLDIAPHRRHRVEWTPADQTTIWLAVFYNP
jgi:cupin 2 domain-containing protein